MPDIIAQGTATENRWRRELPNPTSGIEIVIGRTGADWDVPWDHLISRLHVRLTSESGDRVDVCRLPTARNPVFFRGTSVARFTMVPGEHFVIGGTTFTLANRPGASDSSRIEDVTEHAYSHAMLQRRNFRDAATRIEMLSRLPDLIAGSGSDDELLVRVTSVLMQATQSASAVAITRIGDQADATAPVELLHYDSRTVGRDGPPVSAGLVRSAIEKRESILHLWSATRREHAAFTASEEVDWAFCVPLRSEACRGWAIYVTGQVSPDNGGFNQSLQTAPEDLQDDVKFAELVGTTVSNLRQGRRLERRQSEMRRFFAPVVLEAMAGQETDQVLAPRETNLSVMFCDLRGFSRRSELDSENLLKLLERVSDALGVMTRHILDTGGVIGDFHGDAAMGFWGWPLDQSDTAHRAAEAAARILGHEGRAAHDQFSCGIGIASGIAVAGRIGTVDQVKVTAFGPVVNLASRLEGLNKPFGVEVIIDEATAEALQESDSSWRLRRLAKVRPAGMGIPVTIYELLANLQGPHVLSADQVAHYERGLDALVEGDWDEARNRLDEMPEWDRPKDLLLQTIDNHDHQPPPDWDGVIDLPKY